MANLMEWIAQLRHEGYGEANPRAKLCHDGRNAANRHELCE